MRDTRKLVSTVFRNKEYFRAALPFLARQSSKGLDALVMPAPGYRNSLTRYGWDRANKPGHTYTIKVTACNVWGTQGDNLTTTVSQ